MSEVKNSVKVLLVSDLERSQRYYRDVLGCDVNEWWAVRDQFGLGFKLIQAIRPEDVRPNPLGQGQTAAWDVYAYTETIGALDEFYNELVSKGAEIAQEPALYEFDWGTWKEFAIKDPDGYAIGFGSGGK